MIKNLFKTLKEIFKKPEPKVEKVEDSPEIFKKPEPKVEKVEDSPDKIFNPIFDPRKMTLGEWLIYTIK